MKSASGNHAETRQERREQKLRKKKEQVKKHGKNLAKLYYDAVMKKMRGKVRKIIIQK